MTRHRETWGTLARGYSHRFGFVDDQSVKNSYYKAVYDSTGWGDNHYFGTYQCELKGGRLNRPWTSWFAITWRDYLCDVLWWAPVNQVNHLSPIDIPGYTDLAVQAAARTSPNNPHVDVVESVFQLGEFASLLKNTSEQLVHRQAGRWNLEYQYGIAPVVSDLISLLDIKEAIDRRIKVIEKLQEPRGYRRTIPLGGLGTFRATAQWEQAMQTGDVYITTVCDGQTEIRFGAHCRWKPSVDFSSIKPRNLHAMARQAALGLTFDGLTAWNLMPWSWLIDWGISIGDWFVLNRNIIPLYLDNVVITKHARSLYKYQGRSLEHDYAQVTLSPASLTLETKERIPTVAIPTARLPFLDGRQMGIIASLVTSGRTSNHSYQWGPPINPKGKFGFAR